MCNLRHCQASRTGPGWADVRWASFFSVGVPAAGWLVPKRRTVLAPGTERTVGVEGWEEISSIAEGVPGMWCGLYGLDPHE